MITITHSCMYLKENNGGVIERAGESATELSKLGILLDDETDDGTTENNSSTGRATKQ